MSDARAITAANARSIASSRFASKLRHHKHLIAPLIASATDLEMPRRWLVWRNES